MPICVVPAIGSGLRADGELRDLPARAGRRACLWRRIEGRPYATLIAAGSDGEGAQRQIDRIVTGWRLKRVAPPVIVNLAAQTAEAIAAPKIVPQAALVRARETGAALAEGLRIGLY